MKKKKKKVNSDTIKALRRLREEKYIRLNGVLPSRREGAATTEQDD